MKIYYTAGYTYAKEPASKKPNKRLKGIDLSGAPGAILSGSAGAAIMAGDQAVLGTGSPLTAL